ncbi:MAG TPA: hypothetical protein VGK52_08935 [Polyangia bacterium]
MRNLTVVVVAATLVTSAFMGCGSSGTKVKLPGDGGGGGAGAGAGGQAGSSAAGTSGTAGDASAAGSTGTPDAAAGATGALDGAVETTETTPSYCDTVTKKTLPYDVAADFTNVHTLNNTSAWNIVANPNCDQMIFPPLPPPPQPSDAGAEGDAGDAAAEAGADAATKANLDAGAEAPTAEAGGDAGDAGDDGGAGDAVGVDGAGDAGSDAQPAVPACYEFTYAPDACVTANGGVAASAIGTCWSGVIFQVPAGQPGPGICIASGAMHVSFEARASREGAIIKFGSIGEGLNTTEFYTPITTNWSTYTTAIPATADYNSSASAGGVWNGFSVVAEPQAHVGGTYIFVRNIRWVAQ